MPLKLSARQRLDAVVKLTDGLPFGGTDCALPMLWAMKERVAVDTFVVYTDSETWFGNVHPYKGREKALQCGGRRFVRFEFGSK